MATTLTALIGQKRAETLALTDAYAPPEGTNSMRNTFEAIITDGVWKCANRAVASAWAKAGGDVWVGEWLEGMSYPSNKGEYCQAAGRVCHEVRISYAGPNESKRYMTDDRMTYSRFSASIPVYHLAYGYVGTA